MKAKLPVIMRTPLLTLKAALAAVVIAVALFLLIPVQVPVRAAVAVAELTQSAAGCTSDPCTSASITPTADAQVYAAYAVSVPGGDVINCAADSLTVTDTIGANTWVQIDCQEYGSRRAVYVVRTTWASPSAGTVTFDFTLTTGSLLVEAALWSIDEFTGVDVTTPNDAPTNCVNGSSTSCTMADVGTADAGDFVYAVIGHEDNETVTEESGFTVLSKIATATGIRTLLAMYDGTAAVDETPSASWATSGASGGIGFVINVASGAPPAIRRGTLLGVGP